MRPLPRHIGIWVTSACNQDCVFCGNPYRDNPPADVFDPLPAIMPALREGMILDISGRGEVLLDPRFRDLVALCRRVGCRYSFSTNGIALTPEIHDLILSSPLAVLNVSVNSLNPAAHLALTRRAAMPLVLAHMDALCARPRGFLLTVSMVVTAINYAEMPAFVRWGARHRVDAVRLLPLAPSLPVPADLVPDPAAVAGVLWA